MAWAHLLALRALHHSPKVAAGRCFFIPDDSPLRNCFEHFVPFLAARGYKLSPYRIPFPIVYVVVFLLELVLHALAPVKKINLHLNLSGLMYANKTYCFSRKQAEKALGFKPLFTYDEALKKSLMYYVDVRI